MITTDQEITELNIQVRTWNSLRRNGIYTIRQLLNHSDKQLLAFNNFGQTSLDDVKQALRAHRLGIPQARCPHCGGELYE
jgi:DNA-directed RNA polymerase subunit alpha